MDNGLTKFIWSTNSLQTNEKYNLNIQKYSSWWFEILNKLNFYFLMWRDWMYDDVKWYDWRYFWHSTFQPINFSIQQFIWCKNFILILMIFGSLQLKNEFIRLHCSLSIQIILNLLLRINKYFIHLLTQFYSNC